MNPPPNTPREDARKESGGDRSSHALVGDEPDRGDDQDDHDGQAHEGPLHHGFAESEVDVVTVMILAVVLSVTLFVIGHPSLSVAAPQDTGFEVVQEGAMTGRPRQLGGRRAVTPGRGAVLGLAARRFIPRERTGRLHCASETAQVPVPGNLHRTERHEVGGGPLHIENRLPVGPQ